jgi:hypothetical protein
MNVGNMTGLALKPEDSAVIVVVATGRAITLVALAVQTMPL